jgi:hypothetical protein
MTQNEKDNNDYREACKRCFVYMRRTEKEVE